uniref:Uncharacterized protein n=1 Tax=Manihot esculenta TaxID=3983 RepID=A0A2C9U2K8_MANES
MEVHGQNRVEACHNWQAEVPLPAHLIGRRRKQVYFPVVERLINNLAMKMRC